jgi:hypothetical protein
MLSFVLSFCVIILCYHFGCYHCCYHLCYHFLLSFPPFFIFVENMTHSTFLNIYLHIYICISSYNSTHVYLRFHSYQRLHPYSCTEYSYINIHLNGYISTYIYSYISTRIYSTSTSLHTYLSSYILPHL